MTIMAIKKVVHLVILEGTIQVMLLEDHKKMMLVEKTLPVEEHLVVAYQLVMKVFPLVDLLVLLNLRHNKDFRNYQDLYVPKDHNDLLMKDQVVQI